jgi:hypothetical protein
MQGTETVKLLHPDTVRTFGITDRAFKLYVVFDVLCKVTDISCAVHWYTSDFRGA